MWANLVESKNVFRFELRVAWTRDFVPWPQKGDCLFLSLFSLSLPLDFRKSWRKAAFAPVYTHTHTYIYTVQEQIGNLLSGEFALEISGPFVEWKSNGTESPRYGDWEYQYSSINWIYVSCAKKKKERIEINGLIFSLKKERCA